MHLRSKASISKNRDFIIIVVVVVVNEELLPPETLTNQMALAENH